MTKAKEQQRIRVRVDIAVGEPKRNPLFTPEQLAITKFLTYSKPVKCVHCGRPTRHHWTLLTFFRVMEAVLVVLTPSETAYPPLSPVCRKHILKPEE